MKFPLQAVLRDRRTHARIRAVIQPMTEADLWQWAEWEFDTHDEDASWQWESIFKEADRQGSGIECYALYAVDRLQGLMSLNLMGFPSTEGPALIIDYLVAAPANRQPTGGIKDVGKVFLGLAVQRSKELGFKGRLWLESLRGAEGFYKHAGFDKLSGRSTAGNAVYELGKEAAERMLLAILRDKALALPG